MDNELKTTIEALKELSSALKDENQANNVLLKESSEVKTLPNEISNEVENPEKQSFQDAPRYIGSGILAGCAVLFIIGAIVSLLFYVLKGIDNGKLFCMIFAAVGVALAILGFLVTRSTNQKAKTITD